MKTLKKNDSQTDQKNQVTKRFGNLTHADFQFDDIKNENNKNRFPAKITTTQEEIYRIISGI